MPDDIADPIRRKALRLALSIAALYAAMGAAWIVGSDALVSAMSTDPAWLAAAQRYKGLFYVATTAAALAGLVLVGYTRLLRADALARASELQVHDLFAQHPQPMWVLDRTSLAFLKVNAAAQRAYGYGESEFLALSLGDLGEPAAGAPPAEGVRTVRHRRRSGEALHVSITSHAVPYAGRPAVLEMALDVTRDVLSQRALARQEAQFRQLHQSLGEVLWLAEADGSRILYVSPALETVYGRPPADFVADPGQWLAAVHEEDRGIAIASQDTLRRTGASSCEYRIRRPDGTVRWIADRKKAIVDEEGLVRLIGGIAEDITAARELDAARASTQEELERRVAERTAELKRVNAELDAFARTAAHDLKTPLNGIVGLAHLLHARHGALLGDEGRRMLERVGDSSRQMATLVNDLLALSRVSTSALRLAWVDVAPIVDDLADELRRQDADRRVELDLPALLRLWCDEGLVRSLLANLIGNAWKYTGDRDPAVIRLTAGEAEGMSVVRIEDNGAGFDALGAERLFEPFQRFHADGRFGGTGVGLATCRRIVERHRGRIWIDSTPGAGTAVSFMLPLPATAGRDSPSDAIAA